MKRFNNFFKNDNWIWEYVVVVILIAGTVNVGLHLPIPTLDSLGAPDWLGFWGGFLGGAFGCVPAIAAIREGRKDTKRQYEESQIERRLSVMPIFDCQIRTIDQTIIYKESHDGYLLIDSKGVISKPIYDELVEFDCYEVLNCLIISNCGRGPALQTLLEFNGHTVEMFLQDNGTSHKHVLLPSMSFFKSYSNKSHMELKLSFKDIFGNGYTQTNTLQYYFSGDDRGNFMEFRTVAIGQPVLAEKE